MARGRPKGAKDKKPRKRAGGSVQYDAEVFGWLDKGHAAFVLVKELLGNFFKGKLALHDVRPMLRTPGKPVEWGVRLASVPGHLRQVQVEGPTNRVLLIDKAWWESAGDQERKGRVHACLARAAKEKPVQVSESALRAHGAYLGEIRDIVEAGARQLELEFGEAKAAFGVEEGMTAAGDPVPETSNTGRTEADAAERAEEIAELEAGTQPQPVAHEPDGDYSPEDFDEDGALLPLSERTARRNAVEVGSEVIVTDEALDDELAVRDAPVVEVDESGCELEYKGDDPGNEIDDELEGAELADEPAEGEPIVLGMIAGGDEDTEAADAEPVEEFAATV